MVQIRSPLTGSTGVKLIRHFDIDPIVRGYKSWFEIDVQHYFNGLESLSLYRYLETGYRFFHPPTLAAGRDFYQILFIKGSLGLPSVEVGIRGSGAAVAI